MATPRTKIIALLDTTSKEKLEVTVNYQVGGMSMWDYKNHARGYYLNVTPVEIHDYAVERGYTSKSFTLGSGIKTLITKATRFGAKALARAADAAAEKVPELVAAVCQKHGLTLAN